MTEPIPRVTRNDDEQRYEIHLDDVLAGYTDFEPDSRGRLRFPHTVIDPAFRGRGLATVLVGDALADAAKRGETVVPVCPVVADHIRSNQVAGLEVYWPPSE